MDDIRERLIAEVLSLTEEQTAFVLQRVRRLRDQSNDARGITDDTTGRAEQITPIKAEPR